MGSEMFSRSQEKMTIKSNFARTCNRFSQFLKERRSFGDLDTFTSIVSPKYDVNIDTNIYSARIQTKLDDSNQVVSVENKSLDLFPLTSSSFDSRESPKSKEETKETSKGSMTIIYDGKVLVFEDLQEHMAKEIMSLASQGSVITNQHEASPCNNTITNHLSHGLLDLPITRTASLHRFMEKRKDRIVACAPYQLKNSSSTKELYKQQEEQQLELKL